MFEIKIAPSSQNNQLFIGKPILHSEDERFN